MLFGLELSDLTKLLTVIGHVPSLPTTNSLKLKLHDVVWLMPALEHNHFSPKIVKYFTYIVGAECGEGWEEIQRFSSSLSGWNRRGQ